MYIVFAASGVHSWAKIGGLADVVGSLPKALATDRPPGRRLHPLLPAGGQGRQPSAPVVLPSITIPFPWYNRFVRILDGGPVEGVQTYFVDCPELFDRENFYGTPIWRLLRQRRALRPLLRAPSSKRPKSSASPTSSTCTTGRLPWSSVLLRSTYYFDPIPCCATSPQPACSPSTTPATRDGSRHRRSKSCCCRGTCLRWTSSSSTTSSIF